MKLSRGGAVSPFFDEPFYRDTYRDASSRGQDVLLRHYLDLGWREGRDPSAEFSTSDYLIDNPDVRAAGTNPLVHYARSGRREGRRVRPSRLVLANRGTYPALLIRLFDDAFYRANNPDVVEAGVAGIEHYRAHGCNEGRSPTPWFDVRFYLASNPDVRAAGVDPFAHFLTVGRSEGRLPRDPLMFDRAEFLKVRSVQRTDGMRPPGATTASAGPPRLKALPDMPPGPLVVSIGNTDYTTAIGGVETCVSNEQARLATKGRRYLYLAPLERQVRLRSDGNYDLTLSVDGQVVGIMAAGLLGPALAALSSQIPLERVAIHGLLGHHPATIADAVSGNPVDYWIHDYFALCANPALTRSGIEFCGAPPPESGSCTLCSFGVGRARHLEEMKRFLRVSGARPVAPSSSAARRWSDLLGWPVETVLVIPHGHVTFSDTAAAPELTKRLPRLAFVGGPLHSKGWHAFLEVARWANSRRDIELFHFGYNAPEHAGIRHITTLHNDGNDLTRGIADWGIDAVLVWPKVPETFSLVAHEVMAGGAKILTHPMSGNVLPAASGYQRAIVLDDDHALRRAAVTGQLATLLREQGSSPRARGEFIWTGLTPAVLERE